MYLYRFQKILAKLVVKKVYFRAGDPNNVLLAICKEGNVEYSLYGK